MKRIHRILLSLLIGCSMLYAGTASAETLWEKRRKAYERLKADPQQDSSSPIKKKSSSAPTYKPGITYTTGKDDFGIKKVNTFSSSRQFRNPYNITIPTEYGDITDILYSEGKPLVINIQDYHCNYQAQKQIAYILEELIVNADLKLIMVEGNSKDASLKHLRSMAGRERRIEVGEDYLKRGMISGEEYLDIISEYDFKPLGIEDKDLYMDNLDAFLAIDKFQKDALKIIEDFQLIIRNLKPKVYSKKLLEIDQKRQQCDEEKISFEIYCNYLLDLAKENNVLLGFSFDNINRVLKVGKLEKNINFNQVNRERDEFIKDLNKKLTDEELARLLFKVKEFKNNRISANDFHAYLKQLPKNTSWMGKFPELVEYIDYLAVHDEIEVISLFEELDKIEDAVKEKLFKNENERQLSHLDRYADILYGFYALELIPSQYAYYKSNPESFKIPEWKAFLDKLTRKYKLTKHVPQDVSLIVNEKETVDLFYRLAKQRDHVFVKKIKGYFAQEKTDIGALITGGFHSANLAQLVHDAGFSYMTVLPTVTEVTDEELYHSVLKYKTDLMKKAQTKE
ncbi:MAG: hypothetical protein ABII23_01705 [bacterium]